MGRRSSKNSNHVKARIALISRTRPFSARFLSVGVRVCVCEGNQREPHLYGGDTTVKKVCCTGKRSNSAVRRIAYALIDRAPLGQQQVRHTTPLPAASGVYQQASKQASSIGRFRRTGSARYLHLTHSTINGLLVGPLGANVWFGVLVTKQTSSRAGARCTSLSRISSWMIVKKNPEKRWKLFVCVCVYL